MEAVNIPEQALHAAFHTLDADRSGTVSLEEFKAVLCKPTKAGIQFTEAEAAKKLAQLDVNGDGVIDYKEFAAGGRSGMLPGGLAFLTALGKLTALGSGGREAGEGERGGDGGEGTWQLGALFESHGLSAVVAAAVLGGHAATMSQLEVAQELCALPEAKMKAHLRRAITAPKAIDALVERMCQALRELGANATATAEELHLKHASGDKYFTLQLAPMSSFNGGLEGIVGPPNVQIEQGILREHCESVDSNVPFQMPNRKAEGTSATEYRFVAEPEKGADGAGKEFEPYPNAEFARVKKPLADFESELEKLNAEISAMGQATVGLVELTAARLYTGPMYMKYNAVLRGLQFESARKDFDQLCQGNRYPTTIHCINSCVIKLSKLTEAAKIYRGVAGGLLPERCRTADKYGLRGGVEAGFMSTTTDEKTAKFYATGGADKAKRAAGGPALVFELQMGMIDRGADISWLSQFPHEKETLFPPLTSLEVRGSSVQGSVQVYTMVATVNLTSLTIEQVIGKRKKLLRDMGDSLVAELGFDTIKEGLATKAGLEFLGEQLRKDFDEGPLQHEAEWFNDDDRFADGVREMLQTGRLLRPGTEERARLLRGVDEATCRSYGFEPESVDEKLVTAVKEIGDVDDKKQEAALAALQTVAPARLAPHVDKLAAHLGSPWDNAFVAVVAALGLLDATTLAPHAAAMVEASTTAAKREATIKALAKLDGSPELLPHAGALVALLGHWHFEVQNTAAAAVGLLDAPTLAPHAAAMVEASASSAVREATIKALAKFDGSPELLPHAGALVALLEHSNSDVQATAAAAVGLLDAPTLAPLAAAMVEASASSAVRKATIKALAKLDGSPELLPHAGALVALLGHSNSDVRATAEKAVDLLDAPTLAPHAVAMVEASASSAVRWATITALAKLDGSPELLPHAGALLALIEHSNSDVRATAVAALGLLDAPTLAPHAVAMVEASTTTPVDATIKALAKLDGSPELLPHAGALVALLGHWNSDVQAKAAAAVGLLDAPTLAAHAVAMVEEGTTYAKREATITALAKLDGSPELLPHAGALMALLEHSNWDVGATAAAVVGLLDAPTLAPHAVALVEATNAMRETSILKALAKLDGSPELLPHAGALVALLEHSNSNVRVTAAKAAAALGLLDAPTLAAHAVAMVEASTNTEAGEATITALAKLDGSPELLPHTGALVALLEHRDAQVQTTALKALGLLDAPTLAVHVDAIKKLQKDIIAFVRAAADSLMDRIGGAAAS